MMRLAVRRFSSSAPPPPAEARARLRELAARVSADAAAGVAALRREYGGERPAALWASEYYRHRSHRHLVPAALLLATDPATAASPALAVKHAVFLGAVLRSLPADVSAAYCAALPLVASMDVPFLMALLHAAGTPAAAERLAMLRAGVQRAGATALVEAAQHVAAVPAPPPHTWPTPWLQDAAGHHHPLAAPGAPWPPAERDAELYPWELAPVAAGLRGALGAGEWLQLAGTTHLEALWGAFYASGERAPLVALVGVAGGWGEFAPGLPHGGMPQLLDPALPLPTELQLPAAAAEGGAEAAAPHATVMRCVRAHVTRLAACTLLHHTRRHPLVTEELAEGARQLAAVIAEPAAPDGAQAAAPVAPALRHRLEALPALLHLAARAALDRHAPSAHEQSATSASAAVDVDRQ